ncbi:hypothetical protein SCP_0706150 [Sparassis crispa]|uniref:Uncharacterized protein n=1 Tax=Sparassis crispa TaxID=139825 RepID=A0A401GT62_9APHY|nr:hypothetical protein SCP_0706150 [Sparassis crispa]GBE85428.1 hypothetical protein SCP_0706150 [Sparassis crispa]
MAESGVDVFGFFSNVLSLLAFLGPLLGVIYFYLPSCRQKCLDELLCETEGMWRTAHEEGLFVDPTFETFLGTTERNLALFRSQASDLRTETYSATTVYHQLKGAVTGLSLRIVYLCEHVKKLRATILSTTTKERKKLEREGRYISVGQRPFPAGTTAHPRSSFNEAAHSFPCGADGSDNTEYFPRPGSVPEPPTEDGSMLSHHRNEPTASTPDSSTLTESDSEIAELGKPSFVNVPVEDVHIQSLEMDAGTIHPQPSANSDHGDDSASPYHPSPTDSTLYKVLSLVHDDLNARGQGHPLLPAAAEFARAPHRIDLETLLREYEHEGDESTSLSGDLQMKTIEECISVCG